MATNGKKYSKTILSHSEHYYEIELISIGEEKKNLSFDNSYLLFANSN